MATNYNLTESETQILDELATGKSNTAIGETLGLANSTVRYHLASIYGKLGVKNRAGAVAVWGAGQDAPTANVSETTQGPTNGQYTTAQIRDAAKRLVSLGVADSRTVNGLVTDLLAALNGDL